jgi:hypothetical protein
MLAQAISAPLPQGATAADSQNSPVWYAVRKTVVLLVLFSVVDAAFIQAEMALTGGFLPFIPGWVAPLVVLVGFVILATGSLRTNPLLSAAALLFVYVLFEIVYFSVSLNFEPNELHGTLEYVVPIFLLALASAAKIQLKERDTMIPLLLFGAVCIGFSIAQVVTDTPIVYLQSYDGKFLAPSVYGAVGSRAISLFDSGLNAGIFYCFLGGLGVVFLLTRGRRMAGLLIFAGSAFGCYATLTRLPLVTFAYVTVAAIFFHLFRKSRLLVWSPLVSLSIGILTIVQSASIQGGFTRSGIENTSSMAYRLLNWAYYWHLYVSGTTSMVLFGRGLAPFKGYGSAGLMLPNVVLDSVDNGYLMILLGGGIVGLTLTFYCLYQGWKLVTTRARADDEPLILATAAFASALPLVCLITDFPKSILMLCTLSLLTVARVADYSAANRSAPPALESSIA